MRPIVLNPLFAEIQSLKGVGPRMAKLYGQLCGERVVDLLWHLPAGLIDRRYRPPIRTAEAGRVATFTVRVVQLPEGETRVISGKVELFGRSIQMAHPDFVLSEAEAKDLPDVEPVYRLTAGLTNKAVAKAVQGALERLPELPDWMDAALVKREGWPEWREAIQVAHHPQNATDLEALTPVRRRLA